jgi:hypothetical protein
MRSEIDLLENASFWDNDSNELPPDDIFAFNELRSCADLYRMHQQKILDIQPEFQRDFVWKNPDQTRFIDSLIKQLPIPSLCFSYDAKQQKWLVIDGLQRISTIIRFLEGADWKLAKLEDINPDISGVSAAAIKNSKEKLHEFYRRVENSTIPITVLRCDYSNKKHLAYLFTIFHRLNSTGLKLNNQEIRNCIYAGSFNRLLRELDENLNWRKINKMKKGDNYRMQKQELILRFFAFSDSFENYTGSLSKFLNDYMEEKRFIEDQEINNKKNIFIETTDIVYKTTFDIISKSKLSVTLQDALFVGIARNINNLKNQDIENIKSKVSNLFNNELFSEKSLAEGLAQKQKLIDRMKKSCEIMS